MRPEELQALTALQNRFVKKLALHVQNNSERKRIKYDSATFCFSGFTHSRAIKSNMFLFCNDTPIELALN